MVEGGGLLSKFLSVGPALHFARQRHESNKDHGRATFAKTQEARVRQEVPFLSWHSLPPLSLVSTYMVG